MYNQLAHGIGKAATLTDAHLHVQRRVSNDIVKGTVEQSEEGGVNYEWYHLQYNAVMGLIYALEPLSQRLKNKTKQAEQTKPEDDFVFGGDHESQNSSESQADRPNG